MPEITIICKNDKEKYRIGEQIHEQFAGRKDYVDSDIGVNIEKPKKVIVWNDTGTPITLTITF